GERDERRAQLRDSLARRARSGEDGRALERRSGEQLLDFELRQLAEIRRDEIDLGERDQAVRDAEQRADREMLARLRLDPLVRRHDQEHGADPAEPGEGVVQEALVAGHVDESDLQVALAQVGEAEIDRDAARLLLRPAVAIDAGERPDERGLAVVDVPGGPHHEAAHQRVARTSRATRERVAPSALAPNRSRSSFIRGPMPAPGASEPAAAISSAAARIAPSSAWAGR